VDSQRAPRQVLERYLTEGGMSCVFAESGAHAHTLLKHAAETGAPFDLVLLSDQLAGMTWVNFARLLTSDPALCATRLVLVTSVGHRGDGIKAREAGLAAYLAQPVDASQLLDCLTMVMRSSVGEDARIDPPLITRHSLAETKAASAIRLLVADDNMINQKVAARMLEKLGYRVDVVANGQEVLDALAQIPYAAVFMDCQMPEMDGFSATVEIRKREAEDVGTRQREAQDEMQRTCDALDVKGEASSSAPYSVPLVPHRLPIIAMTANAMQEDRKRCLAVGMDDYISKPVTANALREALARSLTPASAGSGMRAEKAKGVQAGG
jgi:CheY-like chemotaxis protein